MPPPGGGVLFDGRPVADLRKEVLREIRARASALGPESSEHIPEDLFLFGVLAEYDFSPPTLHIDRAFSRDVVIDGTRYLEIHIPMVGDHETLQLAVSKGGIPEHWRGAFEYEVVDGDLCCYVALTGVAPDVIDGLTDRVLAAIEMRSQKLDAALTALEADAERTARREYRKHTGSEQSVYSH